MRQCHVFLAGFITAVCFSVILGGMYGSYRQKVGRLLGKKQGQIEVAEFLEQHFPVAKGEADISGPTLYVKWYTITVVTSNEVATLKVRKMM